MTVDTKPDSARRSKADSPGKVRRRLAWALGSAAGMLVMSITATVVFLESHSASTLPGSFPVLLQGTYPDQSVSDPSDGEAKALQKRVLSEPDTGKPVGAVLRRT